MKADPQRGWAGTWLREARRARGYSNAQAARDAVEELTGHKIHYSAWAAYESGGRPIGDQHLYWLEEFFGPMPEEEPPAGLGGAELAAAIDRQTEAIREAGERQVDALNTLAAAVIQLVAAPPVPSPQALDADAAAVVAALRHLTRTSQLLPGTEPREDVDPPPKAPSSARRPKASAR